MATTENQKLALEFEEDLKNTYREAKKKCKYNATRFLQMLGELGGVATANKLLTTGSLTQSGLTELWKCRRLDISVEAKVLLQSTSLSLMKRSEILRETA